MGKKYIFNNTELTQLKTSPIYLDENISIENFTDIIRKKKPKHIILNTHNNISNRLLKHLANLELEGIKFITIENFLEKKLYKLYIPKDNSKIDFLNHIKTFTKFQYFQKRLIDYTISIPLLILSIPVMLYSAYRIKKESPDGPVIFKQTRIGKNKKPFTCYKFRSMRTDIDFFDHYTQENDPRLFPWGKFMRKTRIDELPQLWNVIKGDLHIIGPRAEWDELVKKYEKEWPFYHLRHINAPGITGWAQVNYPYGKDIEDTYQKLMYDLYYIKNWSFWLEISTIIKTVIVVFNKKGL